MAFSWTHLVRFLAEEDGQIYLGQVNAERWPDVGLSIYNGERVDVRLITGSTFDGKVTDTIMHISKVGHNRKALFCSGIADEHSCSRHWSSRKFQSFAA